MIADEPSEKKQDTTKRPCAMEFCKNYYERKCYQNPVSGCEQYTPE